MNQLLGKAQNPSEQHPMGVAVCGTPITPGLIVWTNEMKVGKVQEPKGRPTGSNFDGWFDVAYPGGGNTLQNPERVITVFEGKKAVDEWSGGWDPSNAPEAGHKRVVIALTLFQDADPFELRDELEDRYGDPNVCIWESGEAFAKDWQKGSA